MNREQRQRAGRAVEARIIELGATRAEVAVAARISARTLHAIIHGERWPTLAVREQLEPVLRWRAGEIVRKAVNGDAISSLENFSDSELASELAKRLIDRESRESRLRATDRSSAANRSVDDR